MLSRLVLIAGSFLFLGAASTTRQLRNIAFDLPDVTAKIEKLNGEIQIEAFRSIANDQILNLNDCRLPAQNPQLLWVSIGHPKLLMVNGTAVFHRRSDGFHILVEMLTAEQSAILANAASVKYGITVLPRQIAHLPLSKFQCTINLYDNTDRYIINGKVRTFHDYPLRVDFHAPRVTRERKMFEERLAANESVDIDCALASEGKQTKLNTLTITAREIQALGLTDKLFGPSHTINKTVYVTRQQMNELAALQYSELKIVEAYEMQEYEFCEAFVDEIVKQTASRVFALTPFNEAIEGLSRFGIDFSGDLRADEIKQDFGRILKVSTINNRSRIVVDNEEQQRLQQSKFDSGSMSGSYGNLLISAEASANFAIQSQSDWSRGTKSLSDQLKELNAASKNDIEWAIEGRKLIPKSISVSKLSRANFSKSVSFSRIRQQIYEAAFERTFALYSQEYSVNADTYLQQLTELRQENRQILDKLNASQVQMLAHINNVRTLLETRYQEVNSTSVHALESQAVKIRQLQTRLIRFCYTDGIVLRRWYYGGGYRMYCPCDIYDSQRIGPIHGSYYGICLQNLP